MPGETDLQRLLATMEPQPLSDPFVYVSIAPEALSPELVSLAMCMVREAQGVTLVLRQQDADRGGLSAHGGPLMWISLDVHSSLEAVGLTAVVATELAKHGISANVLAAAYGDHLLVPQRDAERARTVLETLSAAHRST